MPTIPDRLPVLLRPIICDLFFIHCFILFILLCSLSGLFSHLALQLCRRIALFFSSIAEPVTGLS
jgi:hypothetical protein